MTYILPTQKDAASNLGRFNIPSWDEEPERVTLAAVIPAWQAGMTKVVVIPCVGTYSRVIGQHALLVMAETRADNERYSEALGLFH